MLGMTSPGITKSVELAVAAKRRGIEVLQACKALSDARGCPPSVGMRPNGSWTGPWRGAPPRGSA
jgi:hypothetical protein